MKNIKVMADKIDSFEYKARDYDEEDQDCILEMRYCREHVTGLTPVEIEFAKVIIVKTLLREDIMNHDYIRIEKLFESAHISTEQLVGMIDIQRPIIGGFKNSINYDIEKLLCWEILSNSTLNELFVSLYSEVYGDGFKIAQGIIQNGDECMREKMRDLGNEESAFCCYLILNSDCASDGKNLDDYILILLKASAVHSMYGSVNDYEANDELNKEVTFSGTEDSVLFSKQFERFLSNRKAEIAELLEVEECEVSDTILTDMNFDEDVLEKFYPSRITKLISRFVVMENNGSFQWLNQFAGSGYGMPDYYKPDVDKIIRTYYMVQVIMMYERFINNEGRFTKLDLSREWEIDPERDMQGICYMCCLDVFYHMFMEMMKECYKVLPWSDTISENKKKQYEQMEADLNKIIEEQKKQIDSMSGQISLLESQYKKDICDSKNKIATKYERESGKLNKKIEQKDKEILRLKAYIKSQEEFIALQDNTEPEDVELVDEGHLQSRKYLFVGDAEEALPELKKKFPNSIFMQSETANISKVSVDMIVFLTKWMSHSMYYKVKNSKIYQKVPSVMCNTKNINRIYYDMDRQQAVN
ncbi:MAG: hypothetical protein K2L07_12580 [Lachnospiraceae bacterium]|nr:hypothetical protein [Lachnospiraceae bacterium]